MIIVFRWIVLVFYYCINDMLFSFSVKMPDSDEDQIQDEPPPLPLWQEIQKRTFTNWVNLRLAPSFISDLVSAKHIYPNN